MNILLKNHKQAHTINSETLNEGRLTVEAELEEYKIKYKHL
jgi:hypothetical protein